MLEMLKKMNNRNKIVNRKEIVPQHLVFTKVLIILTLCVTPFSNQAFSEITNEKAWTPSTELNNVITTYAKSQAQADDKSTSIRQPKTIYAGPSFDSNRDVLLEAVNRDSISNRNLKSNNSYAQVSSAIELESKPVGRNSIINS